MLIALHSMCQPGRPGPHGLGQVGSPGAAACQRRKSSGSSFSGSVVFPPRSNAKRYFAGQKRNSPSQSAVTPVSDRSAWLSNPATERPSSAPTRSGSEAAAGCDDAFGRNRSISDEPG